MKTTFATVDRIALVIMCVAVITAGGIGLYRAICGLIAIVGDEIHQAALDDRFQAILVIVALSILWSCLRWKNLVRL